MTDTMVKEKSPQDDAVKTLTDKINSVLEMIQASPKLKDAGYIAPDSEEDHAESKSFGDFVMAVKNGNAKRLSSVYRSKFEDEDDEGLPKHVKTALAEGTGASGGYGVPVEYGSLLLEISKDFNALRRAGATVVTMNRRTKEYPLLDIETDTVGGDTAYAGGVMAYWTDEAGTITESEPRFRLLELVAHKLATYSLASSEVMDDFSDLDGILMRCFAKAVGAAEEYAFFRGDGVGKPLGILNANARIQPTRVTDSTVVLADLAQMISDLTPDSYQTAAWFIGAGTIDQIAQLVTDPLTWLRNIREGLPTTLLGWPLHVVGCLPALNTEGDIILVDPTYYLIGDHASGLRIAFSPHYAFANDRLAWRVVKRVDGQPMINNAITGEDGTATYSPFVTLLEAP